MVADEVGLNPLTDSCGAGLISVQRESVTALKQAYCWLASKQWSHWYRTVPGALSYLRAVLQTDPTPLVKKGGEKKKEKGHHPKTVTAKGSKKIWSKDYLEQRDG